MPSEPDRLDEDGLDSILLYASEIGANDVNFQSHMPVIAQIEGRAYRITNRSMSQSNLALVANIIYGGANGEAHLLSGKEINESYTIRNEHHGVSKLFRACGTSCRGPHGSAGIHFVLRVIDGKPPTYDKYSVEREIRDGFEARNGMIFVCGKTGAGKSSLMAAANEHKIRNGDGMRKLLIFEDPCEFGYDDVPRDADMVVQHEVPRHIPTFAMAVRNSLRRSPSDIVIGECRDYETVSAGIDAAQTGHLFTSTLHCDTVPQAFYRILNLLPTEERVPKIFEIFSVVQMVVAQRLVPGVSGRRVGLREYLVFTQDMRDRLQQVHSIKEAIALVTKLVEENGQTMLMAAQKAFEQGLISQEEVEKLTPRNIVDDFSTQF